MRVYVINVIRCTYRWYFVMIYCGRRVFGLDLRIVNLSNKAAISSFVEYHAILHHEPMSRDEMVAKPSYRVSCNDEAALLACEAVGISTGRAEDILRYRTVFYKLSLYGCWCGRGRICWKGCQLRDVPRGMANVGPVGVGNVGCGVMLDTVDNRDYQGLF